MKRFLLILSLMILTGISVRAQDDGDDQKIRDKMREYIQKRMKLNPQEAQRFTPIFLRYFREWRTTLKENRTDKLILQQKVVELRLRYRNEFKEVVGEKRSNEIYVRQQEFIQELQTIKQERIQSRPLRRNKALIP